MQIKPTNDRANQAPGFSGSLDCCDISNDGFSVVAEGIQGRSARLPLVRRDLVFWISDQRRITDHSTQVTLLAYRVFMSNVLLSLLCPRLIEAQ
jgi:hypothetical protein